MRVAFLGSVDSPLCQWLRSIGEDVAATSETLSDDFLSRHEIQFLVSYNYRHIIGRGILARFRNRAINLHISFLPWNRGADPNLWSFVDGTPSGVTIHFLDESIDTGDIIVQRQVTFAPDDTLRSSYERLHGEIQALFKGEWNRIRAGQCNRVRQQGSGSYHRARDKDMIRHLLTQGWDTPLHLLQGARSYPTLRPVSPDGSNT